MTGNTRDLIGAEILVIDKDPSVHAGMQTLLTRANLNVTCSNDPDSALGLLQKRFFSVVVIDLDTPHPNAGIEAIAATRTVSPTSMVVVLTPRKSFTDAVACLRAGAIDVILKTPESVEYLEARIKDAVARSVAARETTSLLDELRDVHEEFLKRFMAAERRAVDLEDRMVGRDPNAEASDSIRVLVVAPTPRLMTALQQVGLDGYQFEHAMSGGEALDRVGSSGFNMVMVSNDLVDLPASIVVKSIASQNSGITCIRFSGPGTGGTISIVTNTEHSKETAVVPNFRNLDDLVVQFNELKAAFRLRERERRYVREFRQRHYEFLRKYLELKAKIDDIRRR
jgi:DNA-binding NtrC family response regulator